MKNLKNNFKLIGHLGSDPRVAKTESGKEFTAIDVAVKNFYTDENGENQSTTDWFSVLFFGDRRKKVADFLKKGNYVMVSGQLVKGEKSIYLSGNEFLKL